MHTTIHDLAPAPNYCVSYHNFHLLAMIPAKSPHCGKHPTPERVDSFPLVFIMVERVVKPRRKGRSRQGGTHIRFMQQEDLLKDVLNFAEEDDFTEADAVEEDVETETDDDDDIDDEEGNDY